MNAALPEFFDALGLSEEPNGFFYTDVEPEDGFAPATGQPLSLELEGQGRLWRAFY